MRTIVLLLLSALACCGQAQLRSPAYVANLHPLAVAGGGALTYVQGTGGDIDADSATATFSSTPGTGADRIIVVALGTYLAIPVAGDITDNKGNTYYRRVISPTNQSSMAAIYVATNVTGGSSFTVSYTKAGAYPSLAISEWSGSTPGNPISVSQSNAAISATSASAGTLTVATACVAATTQADGTTTVTQGAWAFALIYEEENANSHTGINCAYSKTPGSVNPTWTYGSAVAYTACAVSLQ